MDDDIIHAIAGVEEQSPHVVHALCFVRWEKEECQPDTLLGAHVQNLELIKRAQDECVGLSAGVNDMDRCGVFEHAPEQAKEDRLALVLIAELVVSDQLRMAAGESVMSIVKVRAVPGDAQAVEPGGAELRLETLTQIAFGLWIEVDASSDIHTLDGSLRLIRSGFGSLNERMGGVAARILLRDGSMDNVVGGTAVSSLSQWGRADSLKCRR